MEKFVVIVAGGSGKRFQAEIPKQFIKLQHQCIVMHSIIAFYNCVPEAKIILALPENLFPLWKKLCVEYDFNIPHLISKGGETRFHSVKNSILSIEGDGLVAIHDGVRPLVSEKLILRSFDEAKIYGNAVPAISGNDSLRIFEDGRYTIIDRDKIKFIQTPQCFNSIILKKAYQQEYSKQFTDDATVVESIGEKIHIIEGEERNIKITRETDLKIAEALINQ